MSGFSGIVIFNKKYEDKLNSFSFPHTTQGFYSLQSDQKGGYRIRHYGNGKFLNDKFLLSKRNKVLGFDGINLEGQELTEANTEDDFVRIITQTKGSF